MPVRRDHRGSHGGDSRLYPLWQAHEVQLRSELGDRATDNLMREAAEAGPRIRAGQRRPLLLVMRRPSA